MNEQPIYFRTNRFNGASRDMLLKVAPNIAQAKTIRKDFDEMTRKYLPLTRDENYKFVGHTDGKYYGSLNDWDYKEIMKVLYNGNIFVYVNPETNALLIIANKEIINIGEHRDKFDIDDAHNKICSMLTKITEGKREELQGFDDYAKDTIDYLFARLEMSNGIIRDQYTNIHMNEIYWYKLNIIREIFHKVEITHDEVIMDKFVGVKDDKRYLYPNLHIDLIQPFIFYEDLEHKHLNPVFERETFCRFLEMRYGISISSDIITEWKQFNTVFGDADFLNDVVYHESDSTQSE